MLVILLTLDKSKKKNFFLIRFSTIVCITSKFSFAKKINTLFWLWITNRSAFFRWLLLTFLRFCKFHLNWSSITWTFKDLSLVLNQQTMYLESAALSFWPESHKVKLKFNIGKFEKNINYLCSWRFSILTDQNECMNDKRRWE